MEQPFSLQRYDVTNIDHSVSLRHMPSTPATLLERLSAPESHPLLAKQKTSLAKKFSITKTSALSDAVKLAWLLVGNGRDTEAREISGWLAENVSFAGDFDIWTPVSQAVALSARLARLANQDASSYTSTLAAHPALAVMDRERFDAWVAQPLNEITRLVAEKPSQRTTLSLANACSEATYFRESAVPGMYYEQWIDRAVFDNAIQRGIEHMRAFLNA